MTLPELILTPTLTQGHTLAWSPGTTYQENMVVIDRGGLWLCLVENKNSQPIIGNANWTLVGGTPYVDVLIPFQQIQTLNSIPVTLVGPGGQDVLIFSPSGTSLELFTQTAFSASLTLKVQLRQGADTEDMSSISGVPADVADEHYFAVLGTVAGYSTALIDSGGSLSMANGTIEIASNADVTGGDGSILVLRVPYQPIPLVAGDLFGISAVNQGTKTFTVSPDPTTTISAGDTVTVVGSTGNNRTYTVVSRDSTHIVVKQAIPSSTADGWVKVV